MKHIDPVAKKRNVSFSVILLRSDSQAVHFRLSSFWVKFLVVFFFIFSGASGAAGYAAHYYWKKYNTLQHERSELAAKLGENRRQLGRFVGIEKIKEATLPRSSMTGVAAAEAEGAANGAGEAQPNAAGQAPPTQAPPKPTDALPGSPAPNGVETAPPQAAPETTLPSAGQPTPVSENPPAPGHPALVDEVDIRSVGGAKYQLSFDISNRNQQMTLNGRITLAITATSGKRHPITQVNQTALRFLINRYKKVSTSFTLPTEVPPGSAKSLHLTVIAEGLPDATYTVPMP